MFPARLPELGSKEQKSQQIKGWNGSETDKTTSEYRPPSKIKFPLGVALISACYAGDREEFKRLLSLGVDVNTRNQDGMTCVHQCCINGDYDFLEFLIKEGANLNIQDNEGWTPLHAAASVGCEELVRLLVDNGANLALLSCDMELPVDVSQNEEVTSLLNEAMKSQGIDPVAARQNEQTLLLRDVKQWAIDGRYEAVIDPRTGASPLHVAACKDYVDVLQLLLKLPGIDVNCKDNDGWTPLHAAAHWNREQSARLLVEAGASFDVYTLTNQSVFDVADKQIIILLRQLRERQRGRAPATPAAAIQTKPAEPLSSDESSDSEESESSIQKHDDEEASEDEVEEVVATPASSLAESSTDLVKPSSPPLAPVAGGDSTQAVEIAVSQEPIPDVAPTPSVDTKDWEIISDVVKSSSRESPPPASVPVKDSSKPLLEDIVKPNVLSKQSDDAKMDTAPSGKSTEFREKGDKIHLNGTLDGPIPSTKTLDSAVKPEDVVLTNGPISPPSKLSDQNTVKVEPEAKPSMTSTVQEGSSSTFGSTVQRKYSPPPSSVRTTVNSSRIVTIRKRQPPAESRSTLDGKPSTTSRSPSPKSNEDALNRRRVSLFMSPAKAVETETQRSVKARYVRSTRRSTQGVSAEEVEEAKKLISDNKNNSAVVQPLDGVPNDRVGGFMTDSRREPAASVSSEISVGRAVDALDNYRFRRPELLTGIKDSAAPARLRSVDKVPTEESNGTSRQRVSEESHSTTSYLRSATTKDSENKPPSAIEVADSLEHLRNKRRHGRGIHSFNYNAPENSTPVTTSATDTSSTTPVIPRPLTRFLHSADSHQPYNHSSDSGYTRNYNRTISGTSNSVTPTSTPYSSATYSGYSDLRGTYRDRLVPSGEPPDYRRLYEAEKAEKERLMRELDRITKENANLRLQLSRLGKEDPRSTSSASPLNNTSHVTDDELNRLREENARMKEENGALIRVISKLSKPV